VLLLINIHNKIESEKVIEAVKRRSMLFEISRKSYKDAETRSRAWKEVAAERGFDGKLI
jgi:TolB-like protein